AAERPHFSPHPRADAPAGGVGGGEESKPPNRTQQLFGPSVRRAGDARHRAQPCGDTGRLGIYHRGSLPLPESSWLRLDGGQSVANEVVHPEVERIEPLRHQRFASLNALDLISRGRLTGPPGLLLFLLLFVLAGGGALGEPLRNPDRRLGLRHHLGVQRKQQQTDDVFAGLLATRTGAFGGEGGQLDADLVKSAALALTPGGLGALAEVLPVPRGRMLLAVALHLLIGGERQH